MKAAQIYKDAHDRELISLPVIGPFFQDWKAPDVDPELVRQFDSEPPRPPLVAYPVEEQWLDPGRDTLAQLYEDKGFTHLDGWVDGYAYELARFSAGVNEVGIVKYCGTFLELLDDPGGDPIVLDPINPFCILDAGVPARFLLRLDQGRAINQDPNPYVGPYQGVGGFGFPRLDSWRDYRFAWNWTGNKIYWLVPRRHTLRLYFYIESRSALVNRALGRLMGYTQPTTCKSAVRNVERGW